MVKYPKIIGIFFFALFLIASSCNASNSLKFEEGMEYSYSYEMPLSSFSSETDIFLTDSNEDFWKGIVVVKIDAEGNESDSSRLYRFKISKDNYDFYETDYLRQKTFYSDDVKFNKLTSEGSQTGLSSFLVFLLHNNLYDFDMNSLITNGELKNVMFGGEITNITLEGPVEYNNFTCYKIPLLNQIVSTGVSSIIYISTAFPYLLIEWEAKTGDEIFSKYIFKGVGPGTFSFDDYNIDEAPNNSPKAIMNYTINGLTVDFNGSSSYDSDGSIVSYKWDFGDGTNATGISAQHNYTESKKHVVKLYVIDDEDKESFDMEFIDLVDTDTENTTKKNQDETTETPGFGMVFVLITFAIVILFRKKKLK